MSEGLYTSRDYDLIDLTLVGSNGTTFDLRKIFVELQLYQDMFSSVMSGLITIKDGVDLFEMLGFCGNELLRVEVDKPTLNEPIKKVFRVYKSTERAKDGDSGQRYTLHFCSDELIFSYGKLISKAYKESLISDIVDDILKNQLLISPENIHMFDKTDKKYDIVIPNYRGFEALQWCASRAFNEGDNKQSFFFFENARGFNFVSLQTLYEKPIYKEIKLDVKQENTDPANNKDSLTDMKILNDFDVLSNMMNGGLSSRLVKINLFDQSSTQAFESYAFAENSKSLLNPYMVSNQKIRKDNYPELFAWNSFYAFGAETKEQDTPIWLLKRARQIAALNLTKLRLVLPGDTSMNAGDIVYYHFAKFVSPDEGDKTDEFRSGKYIITSVNHKFYEDKFDSVVEICSDSYSAQLPAAADLRRLLE